MKLTTKYWGLGALLLGVAGVVAWMLVPADRPVPVAPVANGPTVAPVNVTPMTAAPNRAASPGAPAGSLPAGDPGAPSTATLPVVPSRAPAGDPSQPVMAEAEVAAISVPGQTAASSAPDADLAAQQVSGTRQMISAHAPLRDPRIADPNSAENRRILQTMISKAMSLPAGKPSP